MGLFNTLKTEIICSNRKRSFPAHIQFKFGYTRQLEYQLGDTLKWDGNGKGMWRSHDIGKPNLPIVYVYGIAEEDVCPHCAHFNENGFEFDIRVEFDTLIRIITMEDYKNYFDYKEGEGCYYEVS